MEISDWIALVSATASFFISVVAIWQSRKSIKLTERSIREANRPYIAIYTEDLSLTGTILNYVIVKNFGNTGAYIKQITCTPKVTTKLVDESGNPFNELKNVFIAPNQSFTIGMFVQGHDDELRSDNRTYTVEYYLGNEKWTETFVINENVPLSFKYLKVGVKQSDTTASILLKASQEFLRRNL